MGAGLKARLIGLVLVGIGVGLAWFFAWRPLAQAYAGVQEISFPTKIFFAAPLVIVYGLALLIGGAPVHALIAGPPRTRQQHLIVWPLFAAGLAAGGLSFYWYQGQLHALHYLGSCRDLAIHLTRAVRRALHVAGSPTRY